MPLNFRANLLGVAFDPSNSARGYAVGQSGTLLRYGKSWTQEPEASIPPAARGANFTSIAFAGSEAIVAYRRLVQPGQSQYTGGIIVNSGAGWSEDSSAAAALAGGQVPWAVAALPDGGAAFTAKSATQGATVFERTGPGAPWQGVAYPGGFAPGSLTLFRESGALRAIATGGEPDTFSAEQEVAPPPGFPPLLVDPYPLVSNPERGVLRQTAAGWSDEEHELNDAKEPPGEYFYYDTPYTPDPVSAVLVDPSGERAGRLEASSAMGTSCSTRLTSTGIRAKAFRLRGSEWPRKRPALRPPSRSVEAPAVPRHAQPAPARGSVPDVWLSSALSEARGIAGVQAFLYTGPRVTTGQTAGPPTVAVPYAGEEQRYAQLLAGQEGLPVYPVASPTDLDLAHSEGAFDAAFPQLEQSTSPEGPLPCTPAQGCAGVNYTVDSSNVVAIMLDDTLEEEPEPRRQLEWLAGELQSAATAGKAAIVVGSVDLAAEFAQGRRYAREVIATIEVGHASAYFFDAPEQNVQETLTGSPSSTPAYGSGTLGYVNVSAEENGGFIGQSGFLLTEVGSVKSAASGRYPVQVKLIPNVGELAMEAEQGTLLQRSQAASFCRPRTTSAIRQPCAEQGERTGNQPVHRDPLDLPRQRVRTRHRTVLRIQLLSPRSGHVRRAQHELRGTERRSAQLQGRTRCPGGRSRRALLRIQQGHHDRHAESGQRELLATRDNPGGQRAPVLRHDAASRTAGQPAGGAITTATAHRKHCRSQDDPPAASASTSGRSPRLLAGRHSCAAPRRDPVLRTACAGLVRTGLRSRPSTHSCTADPTERDLGDHLAG